MQPLDGTCLLSFFVAAKDTKDSSETIVNVVGMNLQGGRILLCVEDILLKQRLNNGVKNSDMIVFFTTAVGLMDIKSELTANSLLSGKFTHFQSLSGENGKKIKFYANAW